MISLAPKVKDLNLETENIVYYKAIDINQSSVKFKSPHVTGICVVVTVFVCGALSVDGAGVGTGANVGAGVTTGRWIDLNRTTGKNQSKNKK